MDGDLPHTTFKPHNPHKKRIYRACIFCRQRKTKCDLDSSGVPGRPPCQRCLREGRECVLGESNRGRKRKVNSSSANESRDIDQDEMSQSNEDSTAAAEDDLDDIQNPSDALGILAQVADNDIYGPRTSSGPSILPQQAPGPSNENRDPSFFGMADFVPQHFTDALPYQLCLDGVLSTAKVRELVVRYKTHYHPYFPIVPGRVFEPDSLLDVALREVHLLTAIIMISSKDIIEEAAIFNSSSNYMQNLIAELVIGQKAEVEAVETLLILAEWTPYQQHGDTGSVGRGEEDRAAWMYVGMALRMGYFLGLDMTSFRNQDDPKDENFLRHRLVWAACYMSDRQISVRIGKAFWSRGPGPLTGFTRGDFPTLQPQSSRDDNYASIFQATLELTQLFTNVHEILYTQRGSRLKALLAKDYVKYIDDFRTAIKCWNSVWGTLTCSAKLKATLLISYDYLRLYTNAFAFQATFRRTKSSKLKRREQRDRRPPFVSIASTPDARFIYEALDSAKSLLVTVNNFVDPEECLRYMPLRFYLYIIYSSVFLYKARFLSVANPEEARGVREMINATIERLQRASMGSQHLGARYSRLLKRLWRKGDPGLNSPDLSEHNGDQSMSNARAAENQNLVANPQAPSGFSAVAPAIVTAPYDFNWLDLDAVGEFAMGNQVFPAGQIQDIEAMWFGFGMDSPEMTVTEDSDSFGTGGGNMFF